MENRYITILTNCLLFSNIDPKDIETLTSCLSARISQIPKNTYVVHMEDEVKDVGIVLSGNLLMVQEDFWGKRAILSQIQPSELFADSFCCAHVEHFPVSFVANEASEVMLIDYKKLITSCTSACVFHSGLIKNMLELLARSNLNLTSKIELLTRPSTKEKLLSYLSELSRAKNSESFEVPYNRQELADYLSVDRSAMSNELSKLRAEGILDFERGNFVLLKPFE